MDFLIRETGVEGTGVAGASVFVAFYVHRNLVKRANGGGDGVTALGFFF